MDEDGYSMEREQADFDQAELTRLGERAAALRRRGVCVHGWRQGFTEHMPEEYRGRILPGYALCLHCGKIDTVAALDAERDSLLG